MSKLESKKFETRREQRQVNRNFKLEGVETLIAEKITTTYEVVRKIEHINNRKELVEVSKLKLDEKVQRLTFPLTEVSARAVDGYRREGVPSFVLKKDDKLYYTEIPEDISIENSKLLGVHRCAFAGHECQRLSAAKDEKGGCKKVRDRVKRIERYPWIKVGYETFNTKYDCFIVIECSHYEHR